MRLLETVWLGRVVFTARTLPAIRPVSHLVDGDHIIIRGHRRPLRFPFDSRQCDQTRRQQEGEQRRRSRDNGTPGSTQREWLTGGWNCGDHAESASMEVGAMIGGRARIFAAVGILAGAAALGYPLLFLLRCLTW